MSIKRKDNSEDDFESSENEASKAVRAKRTCRRSSDTHSKSSNASTRRPSKESDSEQSSSLPRKKTHRARPKPKISRAAALAAELANLADYNSPPISARGKAINSVETVSQPRRRSQPKSANAVCVEEPQLKTKPVSRKRSTSRRIHNEVAELRPWAHWESEEDSTYSGSDSDNKLTPRPYGKVYKPKKVGEQNVPWAQLPGEVRNTIYKYCLAKEEAEVLNVLHYPQGIPRRSVRGVSSSPNFAHSYWTFTQTCRQVREEFTPWLLHKRHVRTPLATLSDYIKTFHQPDPWSGKRVGNIEPICTGVPLPANGVEILELMEQAHTSQEFRIQFAPTTPVNLAQQLPQPEPDPDKYDEITIIRDMKHEFSESLRTRIRQACIRAIRLTSVLREDDMDEDHNDDERRSHDFLVELTVTTPVGSRMSRSELLWKANNFIFRSKLAFKKGLRVQAIIAGGSTRWKVREAGVVDTSWRDKKNDRSNVLLKRLKSSTDPRRIFDSENLR